MPRDAGPDMGLDRLLLARRHEARRQPQGPAVLAEVLPRGVPDRRHRDGPRVQDLQGSDRLRRPRLLADVGQRRLRLLRLRPRRQRPDEPLAGLRKGGKAEKVTTFTSGDVRFPTISGDGKTIVFEHDFGVWKLDVATQEGQAAQVRHRGRDAGDASSSGATSTRRSTTTTSLPTASGSPSRSTARSSPRRPTRATSSRSPTAPTATRTSTTRPTASCSPTSPTSDGREEIYVVPADGTAAAEEDHRPSTRSSAATTGRPTRSGCSFTTTDGKLLTVEADGQGARRSWRRRSTARSAARLVARRQVDRLLQARRHPLERHLPDPGRRRRGEEAHVRLRRRDEPAVLGRRQEGLLRPAAEGDFGEGQRPTAHVFVIPLEKLDKDPLEPVPADESRPTAAAGRGGGGPRGRRGGRDAREGRQDRLGRPEAADPPGDARERSRPSTTSRPTTARRSSSSAPKAAADGSAAAVAAAPTLYSIQDDGKRLTPDHLGHRDSRRNRRRRRPARPSTAASAAADLRPGPHEGRPDALLPGRRRRLLDRRRAARPSAAATAPAGGRGMGRGGGRRRPGRGAPRRPAAAGASAKKVTFTVKVKIDKPGRVGRDVRRRLADDEVPLLRPQDARHRLGRGAGQVQAAGRVRRRHARADERHQRDDRRAERLAHRRLGADAAAGRAASRAISTGHLGFDLVPDDAAGRYKVGHVYEDGPADTDWIKVEKGNYLIALERQARSRRATTTTSCSTAGSTRRSSSRSTPSRRPRARGRSRSSRSRRRPSPTSATSAGSRSAGRWPTSSRTAASATSTSRRWTSRRWPSSARS